jgi:hypothetical protein
MAYKDEFLSLIVNYIVSPKTICFHASFMLLAILGSIISLKIFPSFYPGNK